MNNKDGIILAIVSTISYLILALFFTIVHPDPSVLTIVFLVDLLVKYILWRKVVISVWPKNRKDAFLKTILMEAITYVLLLTTFIKVAACKYEENIK